MARIIKLLAIIGLGILLMVAIAVLVIVIAFVKELIKTFFKRRK